MLKYMWNIPSSNHKFKLENFQVWTLVLQYSHQPTCLYMAIQMKFFQELMVGRCQFGQKIKHFGCLLYVCHLFWLFCTFIHLCLSYDCACSRNVFVSSSFSVDSPIFSNSWNSLKTTWIGHFQLCFQVLLAFLMSCSICRCLLWIYDEFFVL